METYTLCVDVWEGSLDIDEKILKEAQVEGISIRINNMSGGHHKDTNFEAQWKQSEAFVRWPYFVYNPWVDGKANYDYLYSIFPKDATHVMCDIEVRKEGYSPATYANEVFKFIELVSKSWSYDIYTGEWFKSYLSYWPNTRYTWARYPYSMYPKETTYISWEDLHARLRQLTWNPSNTSGTCDMWQLSADRFILPGTAKRPIDIIAHNGNLDSLKRYTSFSERPENTLSKRLDTIQDMLNNMKDEVAELRTMLGL
jgi:hypothetical protein